MVGELCFGSNFPSRADGDMMVALIRSAGIKIGTAKVWATQDLPIPVGAKQLFLMELPGWQLIQCGFVKQEINIDGAYTAMHMGPVLVVPVANKDVCLQCSWADTWTQWMGFQESSELQEFPQRSTRTLQKQNKETGKSNGRPSH